MITTMRICLVMAIMLYSVFDQRADALTVTVFAPLSYPSSVATVDGTIWAVDSGHNRIVRLNGTSGSLIQQMYAPVILQTISAIAVDASANVYVSDGNRFPGAVLKFNRTGDLVGVWTTQNPQLQAPTQLALDLTGNLYVCDSQNARVVVFNTIGNVTRILTANGKLIQPRGIVVDSASNTILVADRGNADASIVRLYLNDTVVDKYNVSFSTPAALTLDLSRNIYIADTRRSIIIKLSSDGIVIRDFTTEPALYQPTGVAVDRNGNIFIADNFNSRLVKLTDDGTDLNLPLNTPQLGLLNCVAVNALGIYVAVGSYLLRLNMQTGQLISSTYVDTQPPFTRSFGLTADKHGNFYIADPNVKRVIYLINNGSASQGRTSVYNASAPTNFSYPFQAYGVAVDQAANVYAPDFFNARVLKLSPNNTLIAQFNDTQPPMARPWAAVRDGRGFTYVSDYRNGCIYQYDTNGLPINVLTTSDPAMSGPTALAVDNVDNLIVADTFNDRIVVFAPTGKLIRILTTTNPIMYQPTGVAVDGRTNSIIVADRSQERILIFSQWNVTNTKDKITEQHTFSKDE